MGVFAEWQPIYAEHGIPTVPMKGKKPAVRGYPKVRPDLSQQWALKFPEVDALAFIAGPGTKITAVDIDSPSEELLKDSLKRYGDTPIITRTGSGHFSALYLHNGEGRRIRPDPQVPVDILGGGLVIAPPSQGARGAYEFIRGSLDDLHKLRPANNVIDFPKQKLERAELVEGLQRGPQAGLITQGRNKALYDHLMRQANNLDDLTDLEELALDFANNLTDRTAGHAFTDAEICATVASVRKTTEEGRNRFGSAATTNIQRDIVLTHAARNPDAFALLSILQAHHKGLRAEFALSKAMADSLGWNLRKFRGARDYLVEAGLLTCIHPGGRGPRDPAKFRFC